MSRWIKVCLVLGFWFHSMYDLLHLPLYIHTLHDPLYGVSDLDGKMLTPCKYDSIELDERNYAKATISDFRYQLSPYVTLRLGRERDVVLSPLGRELAENEKQEEASGLWPRNHKIDSNYSRLGKSRSIIESGVQSSYIAILPVLVGIINGAAVGILLLLVSSSSSSGLLVILASIFLCSISIAVGPQTIGEALFKWFTSAVITAAITLFILQVWAKVQKHSLKK